MKFTPLIVQFLIIAFTYFMNSASLTWSMQHYVVNSARIMRGNPPQNAHSSYDNFTESGEVISALQAYNIRPFCCHVRQCKLAM